MLSDLKIRAARASAKQQKLYDGDGLYLLVTPAGGKLWRLRYRFGGKEKLLALGAYPEITLLDARDRRHAARKLLANGVDPGAEKKAARVAQAGQNSFETVARAWHKYTRSIWSEKHAGRLLNRLENDIFLAIGAVPIADITAPQLLGALRPVEARSLETAHRLKISFGQIFRWAIGEGYCRHDPSGPLKGALLPQRKRHFATITDPLQIGLLLRHIDAYHGGAVVRMALQLLPLVFTRPGELRMAEWAEVDLAGAVWNIPAERMKMKEPHAVPLSRQALELLDTLRIITGRGRYLFPSTRSTERPISDNTLNTALKSMGYDSSRIVPHGFRAMARTLLDEQLQCRVEYIEHQLAHAVRDPLGRAYNRTTHINERRQMMQQWADYLDKLRSIAGLVR